MPVDIFHQNHLWKRLEEFIRDRVQRFIQALLEEEVTELLGLRKSLPRRETRDVPPGNN
ncbi:MAG: hypothetical protein AABY90_11215 [Nitrospirota bacterium]